MNSKITSHGDPSSSIQDQEFGHSKPYISRPNNGKILIISMNDAVLRQHPEF